MAKVSKFIITLCGVRLIDAAMVLKYQPTAIGLIFVPNTPRYVDINEAKEIIKLVRKARVLVKGVFQDQSVEEVMQITRSLGLDYIQLHGSENTAYCAQFTEKVIRTIRPNENLDRISKLITSYGSVVDLLLLDRPQQGKGGPLSIPYVQQLVERYPIVLAGGLTPDNITKTIHEIGSRLRGVDVSSGVEREKGRKDELLVKNFIHLAREAYEQL